MMELHNDVAGGDFEQGLMIRLRLEDVPLGKSLDAEMLKEQIKFLVYV